MIKVRNLKKSFDKKKVLDIDYLEIFENEIVAFAGFNGTGKSTLLEIIAGLSTPDSGEIIYKNKILTEAGSNNIVMVLQEPVMFNKSVFENIAFGLKIKREILFKEKVERVMTLLEITHLRNQNAKTLSGGEKQKVAIARGLVLSPEVLILDEPTQGLDVPAQRSLINIIKKIHLNTEITILIADHDIDFLLALAMREYSLVNGRLENSILYENLLNGEIVDQEILKIDNILEIKVSSEKFGRVNAVINPENIVISAKPLKSSMRNVFQGDILRVEIKDKNVKLWVDIGIELCALITINSWREMKLSVTDTVYIEFKASAVRIF